MATVLWANILVGRDVQRDQRDKWALYKHRRKLERLSRNLQVTPFSEACDDTDARDGRWLSVEDAERLLETLLLYISTQKLRMGWFRDDRLIVERELTDAIQFLQHAKVSGGRFNFSVVSEPLRRADGGSA